MWLSSPVSTCRGHDVYRSCTPTWRLHTLAYQIAAESNSPRFETHCTISLKFGPVTYFRVLDIFRQPLLNLHLKHNFQGNGAWHISLLVSAQNLAFRRKSWCSITYKCISFVNHGTWEINFRWRRCKAWNKKVHFISWHSKSWYFVRVWSGWPLRFRNMFL